jgi:hypothetical protein
LGFNRTIEISTVAAVGLIDHVWTIAELQLSAKVIFSYTDSCISWMIPPNPRSDGFCP